MIPLCNLLNKQKMDSGEVQLIDIEFMAKTRDILSVLMIVTPDQTACFEMSVGCFDVLLVPFFAVFLHQLHGPLIMQLRASAERSSASKC